MRFPITIPVESDSFDIRKAQEELGKIREVFLNYLESMPRKSTRSKHGLMGPVGKILSKVKAGHRDRAFLKGYALRVHEGAGDRRLGSPSAAALEALQEGVDRMVTLLDRVPVALQDRLIDSLDYGLYFDLRKRDLESKESRRQLWIAFLRSKYGNEAKLSEAWKEEIHSFDGLYLPRKAEGSRGRNATPKQLDIAEFWEAQGAILSDIEEEE